MKKKMCPEKALAVILSASLALSPAITAQATSGNVDEDLVLLEETVEATAQSNQNEQELLEEITETEDSTADAERVVFEEVDPAAEGLADPLTSITAEQPEVQEAKKDPDEQTRVIIVMEGDSVLDAGYDTQDLADNTAAMSLSESIIEEQVSTVEKIEEEALEGESLDVSYNLSIIANAVSADVAYKDIEKIEKVDGVAAVYVAQQYDPQESAEPMTITANEMVGSYATWATGYTGAGTRIAVIDTGIDADHPSFDGAAFDAHLAETAEEAGKDVADYDLLDAEEIAAVLPNLNASQRSEGVTAEQLFVNDKVAYAFNYVDKNLDITHDNDEQGDHGTHVSGIATANAYVPDADSETGFAPQEIGVVGVAPDAQLITMKVFGSNGGAYSDDYMAAIEDAILLKADVVNLSLGSSAAGYSADSEAYINDIFKKLEQTNTVVSISAGNSGRWADDSPYGVNFSKDVNQDTVGSPGSYYNALTVASAVNAGLTGNYFLASDGQKIFYSDGNDTLAPKFATLDTSSDKSGTELPFVFLSAYGEEKDYDGVDVTDKVVFVSRGSITFGQKQMNAEKAGAKAVVIYNNTTGTINMTLQGSTAVIPAISITQADGLAIAALGEEVAAGVYTGTITAESLLGVNTNVADAYTMSTFSSYGVPGTLDLKPEITAPGGNIYSTRDNGTYGLMSGTSMAAPSISGQSALVEQYIRENDLANQNDLTVRALAQSLLMSTAIPLHEDNDPEGLEFSPRSQGAGLANALEAVTSPSYILVGDKEGNDGKVKVVLGDDPEKTGKYEFSFDVYNLTDKTQYYVLDSSVLTEQLYSQAGIDYFVGSSHKLDPVVKLTADDTALVYDLNDDGKVNKKDRKYLLQAINGTKDLSLVSDYEDYFDFNKDGVVDTKDANLFGKQVNGKADVADFGLKVMQVKDSTKVTVSIDLSEADREYLAGFENGMYVDGFIYVKGNVNLSVPFLAFYGSWMDSSMYEDYDFMQAIHDEQYAANAYTYTGVAKTNFLSLFPLGSWDEYFYIPNLFADDAKYIADRNAISSVNGSMLGSMYYTLIRNANRVNISITNRDTKEVYYSNTETENYAAFIYQGSWENVLQEQELYWEGTDAEGNPLKDGTEVDITLTAVPSYYDDVEDINSLEGKGLRITTPIAIDNTDPIIVDAAKADDGKYEITAYDNRYTAALLVLDRDGAIIGRYAANQETKDEDQTILIDAPEDIFYVEVFDYACNSKTYRFNNTGHADTKYVTSITTDVEELELKVGQRATVTATVGPKWLAEGYDEVTWASSNEDVVTVTQSGTVRAIKPGVASVVVQTAATDKRGKHLTASVKVIVIEKTTSDDGVDADDDLLLEELPDELLLEEELTVAEEQGGARDE
jgi:lactocepin